MSESLRFERISFGYGRSIFAGLDLTFKPGLRHTLVGPNAAGKSTLLRLAAGLVRPQSGRVLVGGNDVHRLPARARARTVAVVPQFETNIFPLTVRELISAGRYCRQHGYFAGHGDAGVERAIERAGVAHLASRSIWDLSGGERQRVLIARALAQESNWLLLDEATTFLDLRAEYELLGLLEELRRDGLSILAVTHDLQAAARAESVTLLSGGTAEQGTPEAILTPEKLSEAYGIPFAVERQGERMFIGPR